MSRPARVRARLRRRPRAGRPRDHPTGCNRAIDAPRGGYRATARFQTAARDRRRPHLRPRTGDRGTPILEADAPSGWDRKARARRRERRGLASRPGKVRSFAVIRSEAIRWPPPASTIAGHGNPPRQAPVLGVLCLTPGSPTEHKRCSYRVFPLKSLKTTRACTRGGQGG